MSKEYFIMKSMKDVEPGDMIILNKALWFVVKRDSRYIQWIRLKTKTPSCFGQTYEFMKTMYNETYCDQFLKIT